MGRKVTVIPPTISLQTHLPTTQKVKRKVAGYARVSTDFEEQLTSYEAQVDYYTKYIQEREDWEFVKVYTDEGISATSTVHRDGFNQMVADALDGKIDLIVTKSVSRFARNTVDSLTTVRKLKEKGVEVFFEKEDIYTLDSKGELLITIMSSLAQEESRPISENVTWGQRKRFADGKVSLPYKHFLGYRKGADGLPEIVPEEAEIVRSIYRWFMEGMTPYKIACILVEKGIPTPSGKEQWHLSTVKSILTNEKYKGSALLQKKFTVDFLTKKTKVNEGEVPQYYVEESHPAIISPEEFELVQAEMARRKELGKRYHSGNIFTAKIVCGECGGFYGPKIWHSNSRYRRVIWRCNKKYTNDCYCKTPHIDEDTIKQGFLKAYNQLLTDKGSVLSLCEMLLHAFSDCSDLDAKMSVLGDEEKQITKNIREMVVINSRTVQKQPEYTLEYQSYEREYEALKAKYQKLQAEKLDRINKTTVIQDFMEQIKKRKEPIKVFSSDVWLTAIETVTICEKGELQFRFKNGTEITV